MPPVFIFTRMPPASTGTAGNSVISKWYGSTKSAAFPITMVGPPPQRFISDAPLSTKSTANAT